jgi:putative membrane protein
MRIIINLVISALAVLASAYLTPGVVVEGFGTALLVAIVLGLVNAFVGPVLTLLTLPLNVLTLGLFSFVITALLVLLTTAIVPGFKVDGLLNALLFAIVLSLVTTLLHFLLPG